MLNNFFFHLKLHLFNLIQKLSCIQTFKNKLKVLKLDVISVISNNTSNFKNHFC